MTQNKKTHPAVTGAASRQPSWKGAILSPIVLLVLNLFVFGTMSVYLGNQGEFLVEDEDVLLALLAPMLAVTLILCVLSLPPSRRTIPTTAAVLFFLAFVTYLHGNVLRWNTGILDGAALDTGRIGPLLADVLLWFALGWVLWRWRRWFALHGWKICILLIVFQLVGAVDLKHNAQSSNRVLDDVPTELFSFSPEKNVIHLVLDGFQASIFEDLVESDPNLHEQLEGFVFFRDTLAQSDVTYLSLPSSLSGLVYDNQQTIAEYHDASLGGENLYTALDDAGYELDVVAPIWWNQEQDYFASYYRISAPYADHSETLRNTAWYLLDISLFRQAPYFLKSAVYRDGNWLFSSKLSEQPEERFQHFAHSKFLSELTTLAATDRQRPVYKMLHLITPHAPLVSRPDCSYAGRELEIAAQPFLDQSRCIMVTVSRFLDRLRELGIYDDALILVHGDHGGGVAFEMRAADGGITTSGDALHRLWGNPLPLLLIKPPQASEPFRISERPVSLSDIPATVSDILSLSRDFPGQSVFSREPPAAERRYHTSIMHRNDAAAKGRFDDFTTYRVTGSIYDVESWVAAEHFEAAATDLAGEYVLGTPLSFGRSGSFMPFGDGGWTVTAGKDVNWTQGRDAGLLMRFPEDPGDLVMRMKVKPLLAEGQLDRQRVSITVNGELVSELVLSENRFTTVTVQIPEELLESAGPTSIRLQLPDAASPASLGIGKDERELALAFASVQFDPAD